MRSVLPRSFPVLLVCLTACTALIGQRADETGTVTGRVVGSDTNGPVRMANVVLVTAVDTSAARRSAGDKEPPPEPARRLVQTGLDGTFAITRVAPGSYYVVAEKAGYLQPLSMLTREQLNKPDDAAARLMARLLTPVTVSANRTSDVEVHLIHGAAITGTVRYDDGTPVSGVGVSLWQRGKGGKWEQAQGDLVGGGSGGRTDDRGSYRIVGLSAGEYLLEANLELQDLFVSRLFAGSNSGFANSTRYELGIFYGDAYRPAKATPVKVGDGEESTGMDLTVRLSAMHSLSGSVLAPDGHVVNAARVALLWPDDQAPFVSTKVDADDSAFHFDYVPEGEYTLRVTDARDITRTEMPNCATCMPPFHVDEKVVRTFGTAEQPILVKTGQQGVNVTVAPAAKP